MTNGSYVLAIDQGTSSTKTLVFDQFGVAVARGVEPLRTNYLDGGFVEQDPFDIYENLLLSVKKCLGDFVSKGGSLSEIKTCGITNQRETFVLWDEKGQPLHNAIVWQCKRSTRICNRLQLSGFDTIIKEKTGLLADPYFSGTKVMWLNENHSEIGKKILLGKAFFGTVDTWLLYNLTDGKSYLTDHTNASRTLFFNLKTLDWDDELIKSFELSGLNLPGIQASSSYFGSTNFGGLLENKIDITAMIGDSHAAAFGEGCFLSGIAKATMGTGSSILMNIGPEPQTSQKGMVTTIGWSSESHVEFAFEGVIVTCGATIEWMKNSMGLFENIKDTEKIAVDIPDSNGVYVIPAFSGLGAPHWDMNRKASIVGLTFDCNKNHVIRAALESIPYQIKDVINAMESETGIALKELMIDGGMTSNLFVVQLLADLLEKPVINLGLAEISGLGAAYLAGLKSGIYENIAYLKKLNCDNRVTVMPKLNNEKVKAGYEGWQAAIANKI